MAKGQTQIKDVVVPEVFTPYVQQITEEKARLVQSGVLARNDLMDQLLAGGGTTFHVPSFQDLDNDEENISSDAIPDAVAMTGLNIPGNPNPKQMAELLRAALGNDSTPNKIRTSDEIAVRLSRNNSWSSADLAAALAGEDPMEAIANRVGYYWTRRLQKVFIATWQGVCKDNGAEDSGDYTFEPASLADGDLTEAKWFTAENFLNAKVTMGDSQDDLSAMMCHSVTFNRMQKNNLIEFIPDARGEVLIRYFLNAEVIVDDGMPTGPNVVRKDGSAGSSGLFETWLFGSGSAQLGIGSPKVPTATSRSEAGANGGGVETLHSRVEWSIHPVGHAFKVTTGAAGGPSNANTAGNLNHGKSWDRVYPERKQIKFARLITREA